jgi:uncharacterized protein
MPQMLVVLGVVAALYLLLCLVVYFRQSGFVYYPQRDLAATPAALGMRYEDVALRTADGETLSAWYVPAHDSGGSNETTLTVLHCHGNGGNNGHRVGLLRALHDMGMNVLIFDYRGYGASTGTPSEEGTYQDADAAWKYLTDVRRIPPGRIIVHGQSLGGGVASGLALKTQPGMLVLESTFTSAPDMAAGMFPILPIRLLCRFRYDTVDRIPRLKCPVLVAHGSGDEVIPYGHGQRVFAAARDPKCFVDLSGRHNDGGLEFNEDYRRAWADFAARHVSK